MQPNKNLAGATPLSAWVSYGPKHLEAAQQPGIQLSATKRKQTGGAFFAVDSDDKDDFYNSEYGSDSDSPSDSDAEIDDEADEEEEGEEEDEPVDPVEPSEPGTPCEACKEGEEET